MEYKIRILPAADKDLLNIERYLQQFYESTSAKFFAELDRILLLISGMPYMFPFYPDTVEYRKAEVRGYIMLYKVLETTHSVDIYAIWHGKMDIQELVKQLP